MLAWASVPPLPLVPNEAGADSDSEGEDDDDAEGVRTGDSPD